MGLIMVHCIEEDCDWIYPEVDGLEAMRNILTAHVEEIHPRERPVCPTAVATLPTTQPLAKQELGVENEIVEIPIGKSVHHQSGNTRKDDSNCEHFEEQFNAYLNMVQKQVQLREMATLPDIMVQQQVQNRNMAALPESNPLDTTKDDQFEKDFAAFLNLVQ